jgi:Flp pilus assembly pilin Flp
MSGFSLSLRALAQDFVNDKDGAASIEYGLIALLIGLVLIAAAAQLGADLSGAYN